MAILGNFVNRAMVLVHKYYGGVVPVAGEYTDADKAVVEEVQASVAALSDNLDHFKFREGLKDAMNIARIGNKYLADSEPWKLIKTDPERTATILNVALQICANLAVVFEPFTPFMSAKLASQLRLSSLNWDMAGRFDLVSDGMEIGKPELLFEKVEDSVVEAQVRKGSRRQRRRTFSTSGSLLR